MERRVARWVGFGFLGVVGLFVVWFGVAAVWSTRRRTWSGCSRCGSRARPTTWRTSRPERWRRRPDPYDYEVDLDPTRRGSARSGVRHGRHRRLHALHEHSGAHRHRGRSRRVRAIRQRGRSGHDAHVVLGGEVVRLHPRRHRHRRGLHRQCRRPDHRLPDRTGRRGSPALGHHDRSSALDVLGSRLRGDAMGPFQRGRSAHHLSPRPTEGLA